MEQILLEQLTYLLLLLIPYASYTSSILTVEATISKAHVNVPIAMYTLCIWSSWLETDIGSFIDFAFTPSLTSIDPAELGMTSTITSSKTMKP